MKSSVRGFTLIELMIVVAIIGVLAAVAIPAYKDYSLKAKVGNAVASAEAIKMAMMEYYTTNGSLPATGSANWNLPVVNGKYAAYADTGTAGEIQITFNAAAGTDLSAKILLLKGTAVASGVTWACTAPAANSINMNYVSGC